MHPILTRILVFGCYGYKNIGNDAVLSSTISRFKKYKLTIVSYNPKLTHAIHKVRSVSKVWGLLELIKTDKLLIAGDELINDDYYHYSRYSGFLHLMLRPLEGKLVFLYIMLAHIFGKKSEIHAIGIGKISKTITKSLIRIIFPLCSRITVRDEASHKKLCQFGLDVGIVPDPSVDMKVKNSKLPQIPEKFVVLTLINGHTWKKEISKIIHELNHRGYPVLFIPFSQHPYNLTENDNLAWQDFINVNKMNMKISGYLHPSIYRRIIGKSKGVIGMRMHSIIFAGLEKVPAICIPYSKKHKHVLDNLGIDAVFVNKQNFIKKTLAAIK